MVEIKITVIIPVYNMQEYLEECLDSVVTQSLRDIEIICINDGSNDNSAAILRAYEGRDTRIKVIDQKNRGVAAARNTGIRAAGGKYVVFMDPDDLYPADDVLESLYTAAEENHVAAAGGCFSDFGPDGRESRPEDYQNYSLSGYLFEKDGIVEYKDYQFDYGYHRFVYNRKMLIDNKIFFPNLVRFQDPPFMVRALSRAGRFYALNKVTYRYRLNYKVLDWNEQRVTALLTGLEMNLDFALENRYRELYKLVVKRIVNDYRGMIYEKFKISAQIEAQVLGILEKAKGEEEIKMLMRFVTETYQHKANDRQFLIEERDREISNLNRINNDLNELINHQNSVLNNQNSTLDQQNMVLGCQNRIIDDKEKEICGLKQRLDYLEKDNLRLEHSISYRLGMIITFIPRKLRRLKNLIREKLKSRINSVPLRS